MDDDFWGEDMMDSTPWFMSKTIWGGIVGAVLPMVGLIFHFTVTDAQMQEIATDAALVGGGLAGLFAIYGRIKASMPIRGTKAASAILPQAKGP